MPFRLVSVAGHFSPYFLWKFSRAPLACLLPPMPVAWAVFSALMCGRPGLRQPQWSSWTFPWQRMSECSSCCFRIKPWLPCIWHRQPPCQAAAADRDLQEALLFLKDRVVGAPPRLISARR